MLALYDVPAPAKLNLFLHITGRRDDGYHLLQSVFMLIDWCDTLHFEIRADGQLSREDINTPLPPVDLVLRAARLYRTDPRAWRARMGRAMARPLGWRDAAAHYLDLYGRVRAAATGAAAVGA